MIYGYARVSTAAQCRDGNSLEDQVAALQNYGCHKIIEEAFSRSAGPGIDAPGTRENLQAGYRHDRDQ